MGRPPGSLNKDKPFKQALLMEAKLAEAGEESPAKPGTIRYAAAQLLKRAATDTASFREAADRLDGKPAQAIIGGDDDDPPISTVTRIELVALKPDDSPQD